MEDLLYLREQYGDVFVTVLNDGRCVPWKPLSIGEYLEYDSLRASGRYPQAYLENEVFQKCVLDKGILNNIDNVKAGSVSVVVEAILAMSGPSSVQELNLVLNANRNIVRSNAIHDMINIVTQAYPAYTVEEVLGFKYETLVLRVAQAEKKLMDMGVLQEPINFIPLQEALAEQVQKPKKRPIDSVDLFNLYQKQGERVGPTPTTPVPPPQQYQKQTIITKADIVEHESAMVGHEKDIVHIEKQAAETAKIYADYLDKKSDGKIKMKTSEERKAEAEARMESNRLKNLKNAKLRQQLDKIEMEKLLKVRERARTKKAKKHSQK